MKYRSIICTIILISVLSITVGFSAFVSEMSISHIVADVRVEKDVRITGIEYIDGENITINDINFDDNSIVGNAYFYGNSARADYKVTFTNFGNVDIYVESAGSLSDNIWIDDGSDNVITSLGGTSEFIISVGLQSRFIEAFAGDFQLDFNFLQLFTVSYENLDYESEWVADGHVYSVYLDENVINDVEVYMNGVLINNYVVNNNELIIQSVTGDVVIKGPKTLNSVMKMNSVLDTNVNFGSSDGLSAENNTTYTINSTKNNTNPIYYYRGNVTKNNVLFGNFCWKMVRTTDDGGVKLIYNGVPSSDGTCDNTGTASQISNYVYNASYSSPADVGYMYGTRYIYKTKAMSDQTDYYVYSNDVTWRDSGYYVLSGGTYNSISWNGDKKEIAEKYRYTCFSNNSQCEKVYYIHFFGDSTYAYFLELSDGKNIEDAKAEMFSNTTSSAVKNIIDGWYKTNLITYTNLLEDTVWCNDRTFSSGALKSKDEVIAAEEYSMFAVYGRYRNPSVSCSDSNDSFTVSLANGNGALTYPIGLLTLDEYVFAGSGRIGYSMDSYLYTGVSQWSMSPCDFGSYFANGTVLSSNGIFEYNLVSHNNGVRPAIALKKDTFVADGDGSVNSPYRIKTKIALDLSYFGYSDVYYEPGMTWGDWVNSEYNNIRFEIDGDYITDEYFTYYVLDSNGERVLASDIINSNEDYSLYWFV